MKQSENFSQSFSVTTLLRNIANETKKSSDFLSSINKKFDVLANGGQLSIANNNRVMNNYNVKSTNNQNMDSDKLGNSIVTGMSNALNRSILSKNMFDIFESMYKVLIDITLKLSQIIDSIKDIYIFLPKIGNKGETEGKVDIIGNDFTKLAESLGTFKKVLNKAFLFNFNQFLTLYEQFITDENTKKLTLASLTLNTFGVTIKILSLLLSNVKEIFNGLTTAIIGLTLVLVFPLFHLGMAYLIGVIVAFRKTFGGKRDTLDMLLSMRAVAFSIVMIAGSLYLLGSINFGNIVKMFLTLGTLILFIMMFKKVDGNSSIKEIGKKKISGGALIGIAAGVFALVLALQFAIGVDYNKTFGLFIFMSSLLITIGLFNRGGVGRRGPMDSLTKLAFGLTILLLVVASIGEINWGAAGLIIAFILSIGFAIAMMQKMTGVQDKKITKNIDIKKQTSFESKGMFGFAMGLAILVLTIAAVTELKWKPALLLIVFITAIAFAISAPSLISKGKSGPQAGGVFGFAMGVALLVLVIAATSELNWTPALLLIGFIYGISSAIFYMRRRMGNNPKQFMITIGLFVAFVTVASLAFGIIKKVDIQLGQLVVFTLGVLLVVGISYLISKLKPQIQTGAIIMGILSVGLFIFANGLKQLSLVDINIMQVVWFIVIIGILVGLSYLLTINSLVISTGAVILIVLGAALWLFAVGLKKISDINISSEYIINFMKSVGIVALGFVIITPIMLIAIIGATLAVALGIITIVVATALLLIQEIEIDKRKMDNFNKNLGNLVDGYNSIDMVSLVKSVAKSLLILPILSSSFLSALVFKSISKLNISKDSMKNFGKIMTDFIEYTTTAINLSLPALKSVEPGLDALSKLVSVGGNLIDIVDSYANMKIGVWRYNKNTGKMELIDYKKIDDKMLPKVGEGIGKLLQSLIAPLEIISSDDEYWLFGTKKVKNPFNGGFFGDNNKGVKRVEKIGNAFNTLTGFFNSIAPISTGNTEGPIEVLGKMIDVLSDDNKWQRIHKNLDTTGKNMEKIVSNINKLDITKAIALERGLKLFAETNTVEGIRECIEHLKELVGLMKTESTNQTSIQQNTPQQIVASNSEVKTTQQTFDTSTLETLLTEISDKLDDTLNVKVTNDNGGLQLS